MKKLIPIIFLMLLVGEANAQKSSCIKCHLSSDRVSDTTAAAAFLASDIHQANGIGCEKCHGGDPTRGFTENDPTLAMDPTKGFMSPPDKAAIPEFCARCHSDIEFMKKYNPKLPTDQLVLYKTSVHGKLLYEKKDQKIAVCSDCHSAHGVLPASDSRSKVYHQNVPATCGVCHADPAYMSGYDYKGKQIPTDQLEQYKKSVHGVLVLEKGDQSAPACNGCHGNHGATPPSLASVSAACGDCHASNRDYFNSSPHAEPFKTLENPDCERCHGNHLILAANDSLLGTSTGALCIQCHEPDSPGFEAAKSMKEAIDSLKMAVSLAESTSMDAEKKGVEAGLAKFDLGPAKDDLTRVKSVVHTFDPDQVTEITRAGIKVAEGVQVTALAALGDIKVRQIGLGVSLLLVLFVAYALWRKIKQVDKDADFVVKDK
jgi:predicted CXXCH cytochrome family protein